MQSALYVGLSAQVALEKRMQTIANNIANLNTAGFRTDVVKFERIDTALTDAGDKQVDLADVFGYGPSAPGWIEPSLEEA